MAQSRYIAFLRGINVGGVNLKMVDVAAALHDAGFTAVKTVLATGNVLLDSSLPVAEVRAGAEAALRETFGYDAWVLVYPAASVAAIAAAFPFERAVDGVHSYVTFVSDTQILDEVTDAAGPGERITRGEGVLYWQVPKGATLDSPLGKTMGKKRYRAHTTTRNLRTVEKVLASVDSAR